jgi:hypothetical protein
MSLSVSTVPAQSGTHVIVPNDKVDATPAPYDPLFSKTTGSNPSNANNKGKKRVIGKHKHAFSTCCDEDRE